MLNYTVLYGKFCWDVSTVVFLIINKKFIPLNSISYKRNHFTALLFSVFGFRLHKTLNSDLFLNFFVARLSILIVFHSRSEISDRELFSIDRDYFPEDRELFRRFEIFCYISSDFHLIVSLEFLQALELFLKSEFLWLLK